MSINTYTFSEAVEAFLAAHETALSDTDLPAITQLRKLAAVLDGDPELATANVQFGTVYRALRAVVVGTTAPDTVDPVAVALEGLLTR